MKAGFCHTFRLLIFGTTNRVWGKTPDSSRNLSSRKTVAVYCVLRQAIVPMTPTIYPLPAISAAHTALEQGQVAGKILLVP